MKKIMGCPPNARNYSNNATIHKEAHNAADRDPINTLAWVVLPDATAGTERIGSSAGYASGATSYGL
jgi:hypothetical protein